MSPQKMKGMMKQLGIELIEIENAQQVIIKTTDGEIIIENPTVSIMRAQGVDTYQINGDATTTKQLVILEEDVRLVCEQTGVSEEDAKKALEEKNGDLAEAILSLSL